MNEYLADTFTKYVAVLTEVHCSFCQAVHVNRILSSNLTASFKTVSVLTVHDHHVFDSMYHVRLKNAAVKYK